LVSSRLTGAKRLLPPMRQAADIARALVDEAVLVYRRAGQLGRLPSRNDLDGPSDLERWLLGPPDALALKPANPANYVERHRSHQHLNVGTTFGHVVRPRPAPIGHNAAFGSSSVRRWLSRAEVSLLPLYDERS